MFGTKKSQTQPEPVETIAAQEHKQSIGNQVMEALGVGENETGLDEESEILMPKQNQRQLEAEGVVKESVSRNIIIISAPKPKNGVPPTMSRMLRL